MAHNERLNVDSLLQDDRCCCGPHLNVVVTPETCSVYVAYTYQSPKSDKALRSHSLSVTGWWLLVKLSRVQLHANNWRSQHFNHLLKCPLISPFFPLPFADRPLLKTWRWGTRAGWGRTGFGLPVVPLLVFILARGSCRRRWRVRCRLNGSTKAIPLQTSNGK